MSTITQAKPGSLEQEFADDVYVLTPEEERLVEQGIKSLDAGQGISGEEFKRRRTECLNKLAKNFG